jgi:hypothetical protein
MDFSTVLYFSYFITNEEDTVILSTFEWFSPHGCQRPYLKKLNTFHKKSMKWDSNLINYEKFLDYHGCELVLGVPLVTDNGTVYYVSGYSTKDENQTSFTVHGINPIIFEIAGKYHNFKAEFQPIDVGRDYILHPDSTEIYMVPINGTWKDINVFFEVRSIHKLNNKLASSNVVANVNVRMFVTPAEKYTAYEKFFLPFDLQTWILLSATFLLTFLSILVINRFSKSAKNLVYGQNIQTPFWNVISIFFGISQTKLPTKNFSRFILIMFIFFCLIFRTCFQSKFFEFMSSEPRRPPPKTIGEIIERGYKVHSMDVNKYLSSGENREILW